MGISGVSSGSMYAGPTNLYVSRYVDQLNQQFRNVKIRSGNSAYGKKFDFLISSEYLQKTAGDPAAATLLEERISELTYDKKYLNDRLAQKGYDIEVESFVIKKDGTVFCKGKDKRGDGERSFDVSLGKLDDQNFNLTKNLMRHFGIPAYRILEDKA